MMVTLPRDEAATLAAASAKIAQLEGCLRAVCGALHLALGGIGSIDADWTRSLRMLVVQRDRLLGRVRELERTLAAFQEAP